MTTTRPRLLERLAAIIALAASVVASPGLAEPAVAPQITIERIGWGATNPEKLLSLLQEVHSVYSGARMGRHADRFHVSPTHAGPIVRRGEGDRAAFQVELSARDGRWYQFAYQYAHELCHVYADFSMQRMTTSAGIDELQWFEESLCEAASLFSLRRLAERWADPLHPWHDSAERFLRYEQLLREAPHRQGPEDENLARWYEAHARRLGANPYLREKNEVVANRLLMLFEETPGSFESMAYLSQCGANTLRDLEALLKAWRDACPTQHRQMIEQTMALFGMVTPGSVAETPPQSNTGQ